MSHESSSHSPRLLKHQITYWAIASRVVLILDLLPGHSIKSWIHSPHLAAVLRDPSFTWYHVLQAKAIRGLSSNRTRMTFRDAYRLPKQIHLPPLLLAALERFQFVSNPFWQSVLLGVLISLVDFAIALGFERIASRLLFHSIDQQDEWEKDLERKVSEKIRPSMTHVFGTTVVRPNSTRENANGENDRIPMIPLQDLPLVLALLYFANPVTILSGSLFMCFRNLPLLALVSAVDFATVAASAKSSIGERKSTVLASWSLAVAAYLDVHNILMVIPLALLCKGRRPYSKQFVPTFAACFLALHLLSFLLVGPDLYAYVVRSTHLHSFHIAGIRPSLSTLWYFGMELFDRFQAYFTILLGGAPYLLVVPLTVRLHRYPTVLIALFWMLGVLFRPPGTLYQFVVGLAWMGLCPRSLIRLRPLVSLIALCALPVPVILLVVNLWLWLETGTGEANFCFFQCLAYNVFVGMVVVEFAGASLRRDKVLRVTEKEALVQQHQTEPAAPPCAAPSEGDRPPLAAASRH